MKRKRANWGARNNKRLVTDACGAKWKTENGCHHVSFPKTKKWVSASRATQGRTNETREYLRWRLGRLGPNDTLHLRLKERQRTLTKLRFGDAKELSALGYGEAEKIDRRALVAAEKKAIHREMRTALVNDTLQLIWAVMYVCQNPEFVSEKSKEFTKICEPPEVWNLLYPELSQQCEEATLKIASAVRCVTQCAQVCWTIAEYSLEPPPLFKLMRQVPVNLYFNVPLAIDKITPGLSPLPTFIYTGFAKWWYVPGQLSKIHATNPLKPLLQLEIDPEEVEWIAEYSAEIFANCYIRFSQIYIEYDLRPHLKNKDPLADRFVGDLYVGQKIASWKSVHEIDLREWAESIKGYLERLSGTRALSRLFLRHPRWRPYSSAHKDSLTNVVRRLVAAFLR